MALQFIVSTGPDSTPRRIDVPRAPLTAGSGEDCAVGLPAAPAHAFHIEHAEDEGWRLIPVTETVNLLLNGHRIETAAPLHNGDHIALPGYDIVFAVRFERAAHRPTSDAVQILTFALVIAAVIFEIAVVTVLPRLLRREELWTHEIARQRLLMSIDELRHPAARRPADDVSARNRAVAELVLNRLDDMSAYLRDHADALEPRQIRDLQEDVDAFGRILREDLPPPPELDVDATLQELIEEEPQ